MKNNLCSHSPAGSLALTADEFESDPEASGSDMVPPVVPLEFESSNSFALVTVHVYVCVCVCVCV